MTTCNLGIRWTIGNVNRRGFDALRLSITGAWQIWGDLARYAVCVNGLPLDQAREWTGEVPCNVEWQAASRDQIPSFIRSRLHPNMAEGVAWKFAPVRLFPEMYELMLDNDCILWKEPPAVHRWLADSSPSSVLIAEDVRVCLGCFENLCSGHPRNSGIRGLPPALDYAAVLEDIIACHPHSLASELDEQGLQVLALETLGEPKVVQLDNVSICSPFWPHRPNLGTCGAHFVGLNSHHLPWNYYDRPADEWLAEHWECKRAEVAERIQQARGDALATAQ